MFPEAATSKKSVIFPETETLKSHSEKAFDLSGNGTCMVWKSKIFYISF